MTLGHGGGGLSVLIGLGVVGTSSGDSRLGFMWVPSGPMLKLIV